MTHELVTLMSHRLLRPEAAHLLLNLSSAIAAKSPVVAGRYRQALAASGALENPETTPAEREQLMAALEGDATEQRTLYVRIRLSPSERALLVGNALAAGLTLSAYIRQQCGLTGEE